MLQIYDRVLTSRNLTTLMLLTVVAFGFLAVGSLLTHYRSRMAARLGMQLSQKLEPPAFDLLLKQRLDGMPGRSRLVQDLDAVRDFIGGGSMVRLFDIPWSPLFLVVIFLLHPLAGTVATTFTVTLLIIDWMTDRGRRGRAERYLQAKIKADQLLDSCLQRSEEIWSMGMAGGVSSHWQRRRARSLVEQTDADDIKSRHDALSRFVQQGAQMAMLGIGAFLAVQDQITAGSIVAGSIICARALSPLRGACRSWREYRDVRSALTNLQKTPLDRDIRSKLQPFLAQDIQLQADDLAIALGDGMKPVIRGLDFVIKLGETMAIVGPSGTGKSLLVKTLIGARQPFDGAVRINGTDLHSLPADHLGRMIGYVPTRFTLLDGTVGQNIARFGRATVADLDRAAERAGLGQSLTLLPDGYDTPIAVAARQLTPVHLRFIALARALYGDPTLLVLDQTDDGLDQPSLQMFESVIQQCRSFGQIVVLVTNRASIVQRFDRVLVLSKRGVETFCDVRQLSTMAQIN